MNFQNFKKNASRCFFYCVLKQKLLKYGFFSLESCIWVFYTSQNFFFSTYSIPQASYSHLLQYCYRRVLVKNRYIYFTNNTDVSKNISEVKKMETVFYNNKIYRVQQKKIVQMIFMNYISIIYIIKQPNGSIRWLHSVSELILPGHRLAT